MWLSIMFGLILFAWLFIVMDTISRTRRRKRQEAKALDKAINASDVSYRRKYDCFMTENEILTMSTDKWH